MKAEKVDRTKNLETMLPELCPFLMTLRAHDPEWSVGSAFSCYCKKDKNPTTVACSLRYALEQCPNYLVSQEQLTFNYEG